MANFAACQMNGILYYKFTVAAADYTGIAALSAHGSVEGCLRHDNRAGLPIGKGIHNSLLRSHCRYVRFP